MKTTLIATAIGIIGAGSAAAMPLAPADFAEPPAAGVEFDFYADDLAMPELELIHHKRWHKKGHGHGEGGEGGEGGGDTIIIIERAPTVVLVPPAHRHTFLGAIVVGSIGAILDVGDVDIVLGLAPRFHAAPVGSVLPWKNPRNGHHGELALLDDYYDEGQRCREYRTTVVIDGKPETSVGTACEQPDGRWQILN